VGHPLKEGDNGQGPWKASDPLGILLANVQMGLKSFNGAALIGDNIVNDGSNNSLVILTDASFYSNCRGGWKANVKFTLVRVRQREPSIVEDRSDSAESRQTIQRPTFFPHNQDKERT
jgi:hypothetical protein